MAEYNNKQEQQATQQTQQESSDQQTQAVNVDYGKIQQILDGTLAAKEEIALKAYFKQQGLSEDEGSQAIKAFKEQKAAQQPDVGAIQQQAAKAQQEAEQAKIENAATLEAVRLGIDAKTIPYILKLADLSKAVGEDGSANAETIQASLNKLLEDVPSLKSEKPENKGFQQIGGDGNSGQQSNNEKLSAIFGNTKG